MSKKCKAYSASKIGLEPADNRKAFYAGWDSAIKEALAQHDSVQAKPEPEQEPVAWMGAYDHTDLYYSKPPQADVVPLYTTPPQRTWVGLTDEEIDRRLHPTNNGHEHDDRFWDGVAWAKAQLKGNNT